MTIITTYDPNDDTSTGWRIVAGPSRATCHYRTRWSGESNDIRITIHGDVRPWLADMDHQEIDDTLSGLFWVGAHPDRRGSVTSIFGRFRAVLTSAGYVVR